MFGIDLLSAAIGFGLCALVSVRWPKIGLAIHEGAATAIVKLREWNAARKAKREARKP